MRFNRNRRYTYYSSYSNNRRSRIRWDRIGIIALVVTIVIGVLVWFNLSRLKLLFKGYSFSQQNNILSLSGDGVDEILSHDKMEHIEDWIKESENVKYYDEYEKYITLHTGVKAKVVVSTVNDIFNNYAPKLVALGYTDSQIWEMLKTASADDLKYIIEKGSITNDGISLTVAYVDDTCFRVSIIPHTAEETTLLTQKAGDTVNLECDMLGKYVERLLHFEQTTEEQTSKTAITSSYLAEHGFL